MLQKAFDYQDQINKFVRDLKNEEYLQYYNYDGYSHNKYLDCGDDEWSSIHRVSLDPNAKKVIGYFGAYVARGTNQVTSLSILNISRVPSILFTTDLFKFINSLFCIHNFHKISFTVIDINPARKYYDRMLDNLGGRVVGFALSDARLVSHQADNNTYFDKKLYEIIKTGYLKSREYKRLEEKNDEIRKNRL